MIGVYAIHCLITDRRYIGSSINIENRWATHRSELNLNKHYSVDLQKDYNLYGKDQVVYSVIECVEKEHNLKRREQYWIDFYKKTMYNRSPSAFSVKGTKRTEEQKKHSSVKAKARCTEEWKEAVSERVKRQYEEGKFGPKTWTEEGKKIKSEKLSKALKGHPSTRTKPISEESRERYRLAAIKRESLKKLKLEK